MSRKPYTFTAADRQRATESRAKNKARKERAWQIAEGEEEVASWDVLNSLYAIALDGEEKTSLRVRASAVVLPYLMAKIKARDGSEGEGLDPININELERAANAARHGKVDPAEWTPAAGVSVESEAVRRRRQYRQQKERERENGETNENPADR